MDPADRRPDTAAMRRLHDWVTADFAAPHVDAVRQLCLTDERDRPLFYEHVPIAFHCFGTSPNITPSRLDDIHAGYVYLASAYFCSDTLLDRQESSDDQREPWQAALFLPSLLLASLVRLDRGAKSLLERDVNLAEEIRQLLGTNATALIDEKRFQHAASVPAVMEEFDSVVGRSNCFGFIFRLVARLNGVRLTSAEVHGLDMFAFAMQMIDDLGDWRQDLRANRHTSIIRTCFAELGSAEASEAALESHLLLSGLYERWALGCMRLFSLAESALGEPSVRALRNYVALQRESTEQGLATFREAKSRSARTR